MINIGLYTNYTKVNLEYTVLFIQCFNNLNNLYIIIVSKITLDNIG